MKIDKGSVVVLVVDDDRGVLKTLHSLVASLGYDCLVAIDGKEAVQVLSEKKCDLILSDLIMPNMDGLELLAYVRENHPDVDLIIVTGFTEKATYVNMIKQGAIDFIKKPIDYDELEAKIARALRERRMVQELEKLSLCDGLTGLYNRRAFDEKIFKEVERAHRQGYQLFLAMIDIDNFKDYNDEYGHPKGDEVLVSFGHMLQECTRNNVDLAFRLGGDEFALLLPQTSANQATEIVQRILLRYVEAGFGKTTLSIGLVSCQRDMNITQERDVERMGERADKTMYEAKNSGKNCVICRI